MCWMPSTELPQNADVVEAIGSFRCKAIWNSEKKSWDLPENEQIQAQVNWYRKINDIQETERSSQSCQT